MPKWIASSIKERQPSDMVLERITKAGARVLRTAPGLLLIEASESSIELLRGRIRGWRISPERKTARTPERTPLQRAQSRINGIVRQRYR